MKNRLNLLTNILLYIETNLENAISIEDICEQSSYSTWEFQRIFRAHVGDSIGEYVRSRRLSIAAENLIKAPETRVLDVAIEAQFNSQEAFARAFKKQFGVTPSEIRIDSSALRLHKKNAMTAANLLHMEEGVVRTPEIVQYPERFFIGLEKKMRSHLGEDPDFLEVAPKLWAEFNQRRKEIVNRLPSKGYGIALSDEGNMEEETLLYMAGVEVTSLESVPPGMKTLAMKPQLYALFENVGNAEKSQLTIDYIYGIWLPNSIYERGEGHDYEIFGPQFDTRDPKAVSTYCFPITKRKK